MIIASAYVRVGIQVTMDAGYPYYRIFHCRQNDHPPNHCIETWARNIVSELNAFGGLPGVKALKDGEGARFWVHMYLEGRKDYWDEYDDDLTFLKVRRIPGPKYRTSKKAWRR